MSKFHKNGLFTKLRNILLVAILAAWQVAFAGAPFLNSQIAHAANPSATLQQCRNGSLASPDLCNDSPGNLGWVSGNAGSSDSHWREGDSLPYRMLFDNLDTAGSHSVTIQWDTTKGGKHALDYLTTFNRSAPSADPCFGVSGCSSTVFTTKSVNQDSNVPFAQIPGVFTLFNGTINSVSSSYTLSGSYAGDSSTSTTISFTTGVANPVLAWSGHIASQTDWGQGNSASAVSGSPYHTRLIDLDGAGGNQDRSLAAAAIFPTPTITTQVSSSAINLNQTVTDTATLTGPGTNPAAVTGTVNFFVCGPSGSNPDCTTGGSQVGGSATISNGQATSSAYSPQSIGDYCFRAEYTPDASAPYSPQNHTNLTTECFAVSPAPSTLTVIKDVVNDNGGTAAASSFAVKVNGAQLTGGTVSNNGLTDTYSVSSPQSNTQYTVSEDSPTAAGYAQTSLVCKINATQAVISNPVSLSSGQNVTCTITNDDIAPSLTLNKIVSNTHGGTAVESSWTLSATGPTTLSGPGAAGNADVVSGATFKAGTYTLSESGAPSGYSASDWTCTNNVTVTNSQITLANGQTTVCSITNSDIAPVLTVVKDVVNPYGTPLSPTAFPLFVDGISVTTNISTTQFNAGSHTVTETQQTGYTLTGVSGDCSQTNDTISLTLSIGGAATCTLTNTAIQPKLIVIKHVINDNNGAKTASDFSMTVTGNSATVPNFPGNEAGVTVGLNEGSYSVDEVSHTGYTETKSADCSGTISVGQTKTCTVTNDDIAPSLTLNKIVSNTHGGTAKESDWTLTASGPSLLSGPGAAGNADVVSDSSFKAGTYTLSESGAPSGYSASDWTCDNGVTVTNSDIILASGQSTVCSITNSDVAPTLTVTKVVVNPYGTALDPSSFPLFVDGISVTSGVSTTQFNAGSHTVTETQHTGYTLTGVSGDCDQANNAISLSLSVGGSSTCTLTNTAIQPQLTVIKHVVNDNSGTSHASDFTMTVTGNTATVSNFAGSESGTIVGLNEGSYNVDETSHVGYDETRSADCSGTIAIGETKVCTITNNDIAHPAIHIVKSGPDTAHEGDTVTYTFTVTNTGDTALSGVTVNDDVAGAGIYQSGDTNNDNILQNTETWIYTKDYVIPTDQTADVVNTAEVCSYYIETKVCDTDRHTLDVLHPSISVVKSGPAMAFEGDTVTYHFLVTNTGDTALNNVGIDDDIATGETCLANSLDIGESTTCTATYTIPAPQISDVTNHVVASGTDSLQETVTATDQHTLDVVHPSIHVVKSGPDSAAAGSTVTYTFTVTNTGDVPLNSLTVEDNIAGAGAYQSGDSNNDGLLDLSETWVYTAQYTIPADQVNSVVNTVTACGTFGSQLNDENLDSLEVVGISQTVCSESSHTLIIPKVLAEVTPPQLVNTGEAALPGLLAGAAVISIVVATSVLSRQKKN